MDALDRARARFPIGSRVSARVTNVPSPGRIGIVVDVGDDPEGFVDVRWLPREAAMWPEVGDESEFEVLQHRPRQMRLWPTDPTWRAEPGHLDDPSWHITAANYRVGDRVTGRIEQVFAANRECLVDLGDMQAIAEWSSRQPSVGSTEEFVVTAVLETTQRIVIAFP
jgi:hypothetical protein